MRPLSNSPRSAGGGFDFLPRLARPRFAEAERACDVYFHHGGLRASAWEGAARFARLTRVFVLRYTCGIR
jgi:hypothetical protein